MTSYFWFRRDLRLTDNVGLKSALESKNSVQCIFIFDSNILEDLAKNDARTTFIHQKLSEIDQILQKNGSSLRVEIGDPNDIWNRILQEKNTGDLYFNHDYEPYAISRDKTIKALFEKSDRKVFSFKDQVIFEAFEICKDDGKPYTVYTPYKKKWLSRFNGPDPATISEELLQQFAKNQYTFPTLQEIGFEPSSIKVKAFSLKDLKTYHENRDFPARDKTSYLSPHLRFGTIGIRELISQVKNQNETFLSELIWREFFMQILYHFPKVVHQSFREKYDAIEWRNDLQEFELWKTGQTGYPMVDAGMRQLNETGYMHNRVRMVVASFLCKHLLIDWRWGEAYFAEKLLDYDLSANNGNWQWAAGTGCDAAPYFRVFNPTSQLEKFDPKLIYIRKWVKDFDELTYPQPMVDHKMARERAISTYKKGIENA